MVFIIIIFYGLIIVVCIIILVVLVLFCNLNIRWFIVYSKLIFFKKIYFKKLYCVFGIIKEISYLLLFI